MATGDLITRIASQDTLLSVLDEVQRIGAAVVDATKIDWKSLFESRATGEVFSTKFYTYETSTSSLGEKMNASVGLKAVPSTETSKGRDDFAVRNAFSFIDCNFVCNEAGKRVPSKIKGQAGFSYTGKVDVGVLTPPTYWGVERHYDKGYYIVHFSDRPHPELGLVPTPWCVDASGNEMGYGLVSKYWAGYIDNTLYSSSGLALAGFMSHNQIRTEMQKKGTGYYGAGSERTAYLLCMLWIKYATKNSQSIFKGCADYNIQTQVAQATTGQKYVIIPTTAANSLATHTAVSIGDPGSDTNHDRGNSKMYNIKDRVNITKIEAISGTSNSKVYVDADAFNTTTTTWLSTMPCRTGGTDNILGADGYIANDNKHSFRINGIEEGMGAWFVSANELWNKDSATVTSYYVRGAAAWSASASGYKKVATADMKNSNDQWIGDIEIDEKTGIIWPRVYGSGDSVGVGDHQWKGGTGTGMREALERAGFRDGSHGGFSASNLWHAPADRFWYFSAGV